MLSGAGAAHHTATPRVLAAITALFFLGFFASEFSASQHQPDRLEVAAAIKPDAASRIRVAEAFGRQPLSFEANQGQVDGQVDFLARGSGYTLFLTTREAVLLLRARAAPLDARDQRGGSAAVLRMQLSGANAQPHVAGMDALSGKVNYFIGNDPRRWRTNIPTYAKVAYQDVYAGIDLVYHGAQGRLEYDFIVQPGADPAAIALAFQGAERLELDADGNLVVHTAAGPVRQPKPVIYQEVGGLRRDVAGGYVLKGPQQVRLHLAAYDASRPLIIDPALFYSTYLGGSNDDVGFGIAVDTVGNAYVTGFTDSTNFPTTTGAFQPVFGGTFDAFVTKLNPTGSGLVYSTYLGGGGTDVSRGIAVDTLGNAYVTGATSSSNFPTTPGAFQTAFGGVFDAFVTKLNPTGSMLVYSTYLGGSNDDDGGGLAIDTVGNAYVTGRTASSNFPTTAGAFDTTFNGATDAFVAKVDATGSGLVYSTFLGGSGFENSVFSFGGIVVDASGNAYVTGGTESSDFPTTVGAFQPASAGNEDAFVTKLNPTGSGVVYSTYLSGSSTDVGTAITVDGSGNAYVTGVTFSANFPTTPGAFDTTANGENDVFIAKLNATGSSLVYSTYLGGSDSEFGRSIAVDSLSNAHVTGETRSLNFPTTPGAFQPAFGGPLGDFDAFVTKLNPTGSGLVYSSYLGGNGEDRGLGIAVDTLPSPNAYVTGLTRSSNFPTTSGAFQPVLAGPSDAFVAKIIDIVLPPGPTVGKVTGGGSINVAQGIGTFGFIVQRQVADASIHGDLQYVNHATKTEVRSVMITTFVISGTMATFGGTCTRDRVPCTFTVKVMDNGEPGTTDSFTIIINAGPPEGGTLRDGNIQIHQ